MSGNSILYISSELYPYFPETNLSKRALIGPKEMSKDGNDVRIFMPRFGFINERRFQLHEVIRLSGMNLVINDIDQPLIIKVASIPGERLQTYFIDNDEYFKRKTVYADQNNKLHSDNDERAIFFARGVLETVKKLNWKPDIIHVHGWMASLIPLYLKKFYGFDSFFNDTSVVVSLFNDEFEGKLNENFIEKLKFDGFDLQDVISLTNPTYENLMRLAISYSDSVIKGEEQIPDSINAILPSFENIDIHEYNEDPVTKTYNSAYQQVLSNTILDKG